MARQRLGELVDEPGWLETPLAVRGTAGRLACFDYPVHPSPGLLRWYIDHPERLTWPEAADGSPRTARLRRALLYDDPPGSQERAQERARELLRSRSALSREWWRFEDLTRLDCVLITNRLVVTVEAEIAPTPRSATPWYPARPALARTTEAAQHLSQGRRWTSLLLSEDVIEAASPPNFARSLSQAAPHLCGAERQELADAYLGNLTWSVAVEAVDLNQAELAPPDS
jgi:hypothetical protein